MTAHISCRSLTQIGLQIPRWRTKWHRNNHTIQNSIEFKASAHLLHDTLRSQPEQNKRQEILDIRQVAALNFVLFGGGLNMCICPYVVVRVWLMFVHMCVKRSCSRCMAVKVKV